MRRRKRSGESPWTYALLVAILIPFQGHIDKPWSAVLAEVLGSTGWAVFIFYLARYVARKVGAPAA